MGYRNHLFVCQHCGVVKATASETPPEACVVCEARTFSPYALNDLVRPVGETRRSSRDDEEAIPEIVNR